MNRRTKSNKGRAKGILLFLFAVYSLVMIWLLFLYRTQQTEPLYNFVPFKTLEHFWNLYRHSSGEVKLSAIINLYGNVIFFMPLGFFIPRLWDRQKNFLIFFLTLLILIVSVELLQGLSRLGTADVDDVLLNVVGGILGFLIDLPIRNRKKRK